MSKLKTNKYIISNLPALIVRIMIVIPVMYVILFPLFTMISTSLLDKNQVLDPSIIWIPRLIRDDNFKVAIKALNYIPSLLRTLEINIVSALIEVVTCSITAYGLSRFKFKGKSILLLLLIMTIIVPQEMIATPTYLQFKFADFLGILKGIGSLIGKDIRPNLIDTPWSFWIPSFLSVGLRSGLFIFIYMQFYKGLPKELEEAAYIDGAGPLRTFVKIIVPSSGVVILTVTIFSVIWHWNDYYLSSLYFSENFPLAVSLSRIIDILNTIPGSQKGYSSHNGIIMAACLLFVLPVLVMYLILQRNFVKSIDRVGIVG